MRRMSIVLALALVLPSFGLSAQPTPPTPPLPNITSISVPAPGKIAKLNDALDIGFDKLESKDLSKFTLYLNGYAMPELTPAFSGPNRIRFILKRDPPSDKPPAEKKTKQAWTMILGAPTAHVTYVDVGLRYDNAVVPTTLKSTKIPFQVFVPWIAVFWMIVLLILIGLFWIAAITTNILRDTVPPAPPAGKKRPYSLARTQMAWWFLLVIASFIFIFAITQDWRTINEEALILMGICTGTALGATIIEVTKQNSASSTLADLKREQAKAQIDFDQQTAVVNNLKAAVPRDAQAIAAAEKTLAANEADLTKANDNLAAARKDQSSPVSTNFFDDLLTDANGANVHRFQMVGWTVVLGIIYLYGVWKLLSLPDFNATLNALLGISAGTYLGFKIPEKQA